MEELKTSSIHIVKGNCLDIMKNIEDRSIDLIVTDVPYPVISGGKPKHKGQPSGILSKNDGKIFNNNNIKPCEYMSELYRVLKEDTHCYIFINFMRTEKKNSLFLFTLRKFHFYILNNSVFYVKFTNKKLTYLTFNNIL